MSLDVTGLWCKQPPGGHPKSKSQFVHLVRTMSQQKSGKKVLRNAFYHQLGESDFSSIEWN